MKTLRLLNLRCNKTDNDDNDNNNNNTKVNEIILTVDDGKFQGFGPESMMNGSIWNLNKNIQFNEKAIISLFDEDLILNLSNIKHVRIHTIEENEVREGQKKVSFNSDNANYVLTYEII